jgi:hypothetical protein
MKTVRRVWTTVKPCQASEDEVIECALRDKMRAVRDERGRYYRDGGVRVPGVYKAMELYWPLMKEGHEPKVLCTRSLDAMRELCERDHAVIGLGIRDGRANITACDVEDDIVRFAMAHGNSKALLPYRTFYCYDKISGTFEGPMRLKEAILKTVPVASTRYNVMGGVSMSVVDTAAKFGLASSVAEWMPLVEGESYIADVTQLNRPCTSTTKHQCGAGVCTTSAA